MAKCRSIICESSRLNEAMTGIESCKNSVIDTFGAYAMSRDELSDGLLTVPESPNHVIQQVVDPATKATHAFQ